MATRTAIITISAAAALLSTPASAEALGGIQWGAEPAELLAAFPYVEPSAQGDGFVSLPLPALGAAVRSKGGFCPTTVCLTTTLNEGAEATYSFRGGLAEVYVSFSRPFADLVSDMGLLTEIQRGRVARSEFQQMSAEFASRYGAPAIISDVERQYGDVIVVGGATYLAEDGGIVAISIGWSGKNIAGDIWYLPPGRKGGF